MLHKRKIAVLIATVMMLGLLVGCAGSKSDGKTADPATSSTATGPAKTYNFQMLGMRTTPNADSEVMKQFNENLGGNTLEVTSVPDPDYLAKIQLLMAAQDLPDIFLTWGNQTVLEKGTAKFTEDELKTYMPDIYKIAEKQYGQAGMSMDSVLARSTVDGKIAGISVVQTINTMPYGLLIRQDILDELGQSMPETIADWDALFKAYKEKYPDRYPFTTRGKDWITGSFRWVMNAYGIAYEGWSLKDGKLSYDAFSPEMRQALGKLQEWYKAGYINPEWVTTDNKLYMDTFGKGDMLFYQILNPTTSITPPYTKGSMLDLLMTSVPDAKVAWAPYPAAQEGTKPTYPTGDPVGTNFVSFGSHLEKDGDKLHAAMDVLNKGVSKDMYVLRSFGIEGKTFDYVDGAPQFKPEFSNADAQAKAGISWMGVFNAFSDWDVQMSFMQKNVQDQITSQFLSPDGIYGKNNIAMKVILPPGPITSPSGEDLSVKGKAKSDQWNSIFSEVVVGRKSLEDYDKFIAEWKKEVGDDQTEAMNRLYLKDWPK